MIYEYCSGQILLTHCYFLCNSRLFDILIVIICVVVGLFGSLQIEELIAG